MYHVAVIELDAPSVTDECETVHSGPVGAADVLQIVGAVPLHNLGVPALHPGTIEVDIARRVTADDVGFAVDFEQIPWAVTANALQVWHLD
jgi:hypothetical protein